MPNENYRENRQSSSFNIAALDARKRLLLVRRRRYYIAAVTLLSLSSLFGLVTITVNIVSSTLKKITLPYLILYYIISGFVSTHFIFPIFLLVYTCVRFLLDSLYWTNVSQIRVYCDSLEIFESRPLGSLARVIEIY